MIPCPSFTYSFPSQGAKREADEPELYSQDEPKNFQLPDDQIFIRTPLIWKEITLTLEILNALRYGKKNPRGTENNSRQNSRMVTWAR